ncbi:DoxX family protein [Prochlorococcus sp. MIT 1300]|uniref:DoxX family protein n=1 Tax=Prochlorococcus sp. MIT 1300 TaxID=3096218 RepID=UPI002A758082|nr:DoxX family protein [Prochlorococcus sp. MIT 1300]
MALVRSRWIEVCSRFLIASVFINALPSKIINFQSTANWIASNGIPASHFLLSCAIILMISGSLFLIIGRPLRLGAILLLIFLVPTTLLFHSDLSTLSERNAFTKNLAIIGGLSLVANRAGKRKTIRKE